MTSPTRSLFYLNTIHGIRHECNQTHGVRVLMYLLRHDHSLSADLARVVSSPIVGTLTMEASDIESHRLVESSFVLV